MSMRRTVDRNGSDHLTSRKHVSHTVTVDVPPLKCYKTHIADNETDSPHPTC